MYMLIFVIKAHLIYLGKLFIQKCVNLKLIFICAQKNMFNANRMCSLVWSIWQEYIKA